MTFEELERLLSCDVTLLLVSQEQRDRTVSHHLYIYPIGWHTAVGCLPL